MWSSPPPARVRHSLRFEDLTDPELDHYSRIQWLARIFNLTLPSRAHVNRSRGCNFSRKSAKESFGSSPAGTPLRDESPSSRGAVSDAASDTRAREDAALGRILRPWQEVMEKLIQLHGHQVVRSPRYGRADVL